MHVACTLSSKAVFVLILYLCTNRYTSTLSSARSCSNCEFNSMEDDYVIVNLHVSVVNTIYLHICLIYILDLVCHQRHENHSNIKLLIIVSIFCFHNFIQLSFFNVRKKNFHCI